MYNNRYWEKYLELNDKLVILEHQRDGLEKGTSDYISISAKIEACLCMMDSNLQMSRMISK
ncbi:hypothetical protein [Clostridium sp.]|uniref:hypothetical protein n=1 Tax=Clostridium sp. TaxID=1506 RepID=UPI003F3E7660